MNDYACKVCGNEPDENGVLRHGKGCYVVSEDGGGESYVEVSEAPAREGRPESGSESQPVEISGQQVESPSFPSALSPEAERERLNEAIKRYANAMVNIPKGYTTSSEALESWGRLEKLLDGLLRSPVASLAPTPSTALPEKGAPTGAVPFQPKDDRERLLTEVAHTAYIRGANVEHMERLRLVVRSVLLAAQVPKVIDQLAPTFADDATREEFQRSFFAPEPTPPSLAECVWTENSDGYHDTGCGKAFALDSGTPTENSFRFCVYCGHPLAEAARPPKGA